MWNSQSDFQDKSSSLSSTLTVLDGDSSSPFTSSDAALPPTPGIRTARSDSRAIQRLTALLRTTGQRGTLLASLSLARRRGSLDLSAGDLLADLFGLSLHGAEHVFVAALRLGSIDLFHHSIVLRADGRARLGHSCE